MKLLEMFVHNPAPVAKARPRFTRNGRTYTPKSTRQAEESLAYIARLVRQLSHPWEGEVSLQIQVYLTRPKSSKRPSPTVKPDLDNYIKLVCDALNGIVWRDDSQVTQVSASKTYCEPHSEEPAGYWVRAYSVESDNE